MERPPAPGVLDPRDPAPEARARLRLWLALQAVFAFQPERAAPRLAEGQAPEALLRAAPLPAPPPGELERRARVLARHGAVLVPLPAPAYPERLRRLADAPPVLAVRGDPRALALRCVSIVGARAATDYGRAVARQLARDLGRAGLCVVSGLARGVDAEAHRGALDAGGPTVAFLGCGPERVYPAEHRALAARIAESGAVVTELPVGSGPRGVHFPLRNRLIAALAEAVVVVEARERSGSLSTARHAADLGVDVLAVPGPIDAESHRGANRLLRDGAGVVTGADDVLGALGLPPLAASRALAQPALARAPGPRAVLGALARGPRTRDELLRGLGLPAGDVALALLALELEGAVAEDRDGRVHIVSPLRGERL